MDSGVRAGQLRVVAQGLPHHAERLYLVLREHHSAVTPEGRWLHFWEILLGGEVSVWGEHTISSDHLVSEPAVADTGAKQGEGVPGKVAKAGVARPRPRIGNKF